MVTRLDPVARGHEQAAEEVRERYPRSRARALRFLGPALGAHLLLGIALSPGAILTGTATFLVLGLHRFGLRRCEAVSAGLVATIGACYLAGLYCARPPLGTVGLHMVKPQFQGS